MQNTIYQGIEHVLKTFSKDKPLTILLDKKSVLKICVKLPLKYKDKLDVEHQEMINKIEKLLLQRIASITWLHIYSHLNDNNPHATLKQKVKVTEK